MKMTLKSKYGVRVLGWEPQPGQPLPLPRLEDDRALFKPGVVKNVLAMLDKEHARFEKERTPTPIHISIGKTIDGHKLGLQTRSRLKVTYGHLSDPLEVIEASKFRCSTIEVVLRSKKGAPITAKFYYLAARDEEGRAIVGPYLRHERTGPLILVAS